MGIVHLAGAPGRERHPQICSLCSSELPGPPGGGAWPIDSLVTVEKRAAEVQIGSERFPSHVLTASRGAQRGSVRCSAKLLEPQEDGA